MSALGNGGRYVPSEFLSFLAARAELRAAVVLRTLLITCDVIDSTKQDPALPILYAIMGKLWWYVVIYLLCYRPRNAHQITQPPCMPVDVKFL